MSDIGNTNRTAPASAVQSVADKPYLPAEGLAGRQKHGQNPENTNNPYLGHDPAVSIAASIAHLKRGDLIDATISHLDSEGRPVLKAAEAEFALRPDAGLKPADRVSLQLLDTSHQLTALLIRKNDLQIDPPLLLQVTVIGVKHPEAQTTEVEQDAQEAGRQRLDSNPSYARLIRHLSQEASVKAPIEANLDKGKTDTQEPDIKTQAKTIISAGARIGAHTQDTSSVFRPLASPLQASNPQASNPQASNPQASNPQASNPQASNPPDAPPNSPSEQASPKALSETPPELRPETPPEAAPEITPKSSPATPTPAAPNAVALPTITPSETTEIIPQNFPIPHPPIPHPPSPHPPSPHPPSPSNTSETAYSPAPLFPSKNQTTISHFFINNIAASAAQAEGRPLIVWQRDGTSFLLHPLATGSKNSGLLIESAQAFNPSALPAEQAAELAKAAGSADLLLLSSKKGKYIIPRAIGERLIGQYFTITPSPLGPFEQPAHHIYPASFLRPDGSAHPVGLKFSGPDDKAASPSHFKAQVNNYQLLRAFLSATGPQADLRLRSSVGDILVTLPGALRPQAGSPFEVIGLDRALIEPNSDLPRPNAPSAALAEALANAVQSLPPLGLASDGLTSGWPALEASLALTAEQNYANHNETGLGLRTAAGGPRLSNIFHFFLHALGVQKKLGGQAGADLWIGDKTKPILENKTPGLLDLLRADIQRLFKFSEEAPQDWRAFQLPFDLKEGDMSFLHLLTRRDFIDPDQKGDNPKEKEQKKHRDRFLIEVRFSHLGQIQLDGRLEEKHFDLLLYHQGDLGEKLRQSLRQVFYQAMEAESFSGEFIIKDQRPLPNLFSDIWQQKQNTSERA